MIFGRMVDPTSESKRMNGDMTLMSALRALVKDRQARFEKIKTYREYEAGEKYADLNDSQKTLLGREPKFSINICPSVLTAKCDRLDIAGVSVNTAESAIDVGTINELLEQWWSQSKVDEVAKMIHYAASRDGDAYLIVSHDGEKPVFTFEPAFDGATGVMVAYADGKPVYGFRRYTTVDPNRPTADPIERLNMYYPNRIEKYYSITTGQYLEAGWIPYLDENGQHVQYLTDTGTETGKPLGLPIIHFRNNSKGDDYGVSDLALVVPSLQDSLNIAGVSIVAAAQLAGFPMNYVFGVDAPDDSQLPSYPGMLLVHPGNTEKGVTVGQFPAADLRQLIDVKNDIIRSIATISHTPLSHFNTTGQIASEGTLQQQEAPLLAKVETAQQQYATSYEQALKIALKWDTAYNDASVVGLSFDQIDKIEVTVQWGSPQVRNEFVDAQTAQLHTQMGVPQEMIWRKFLGYTNAEINEMKKMVRDQQASAAAAMARQQRAMQGRAILNGDNPNERQPASPAGAVEQGQQQTPTNEAGDQTNARIAA